MWPASTFFAIQLSNSRECPGSHEDVPDQGKLEAGLVEIAYRNLRFIKISSLQIHFYPV